MSASSRGSVLSQAETPEHYPEYYKSYIPQNSFIEKKDIDKIHKDLLGKHHNLKSSQIYPSDRLIRYKPVNYFQPNDVKYYYVTVPKTLHIDDIIVLQNKIAFYAMDIGTDKETSHAKFNCRLLTKREFKTTNDADLYKYKAVVLPQDLYTILKPSDNGYKYWVDFIKQYKNLLDTKLSEIEQSRQQTDPQSTGGNKLKTYITYTNKNHKKCRKQLYMFRNKRCVKDGKYKNGQDKYITIKTFLKRASI